MPDDTLNKTIESVRPEKLENMRQTFQRELEMSGAIHVEAAQKFQAGLDKVVDVLLILVLKFGRATTALLAIGFVILISLVTMIIATVKIIELSSAVAEIQQHQEEASLSAQRIEKATTDTQKQVDTTSKKIDDTQAKVDSVAASTPQVEVDSRTGKAKLVIQATKKRHVPPVVSAVPAPTQVPVELDLK
jgi:type II secretory pathway pseudopilin PulG